uniref:Uncharacterized protein n=1 Tax=Knipowitschia caucasica TaxID=637954 RepID=A0AAV2LUM0_KNICA
MTLHNICWLRRNPELARFLWCLECGEWTYGITGRGQRVGAKGGGGGWGGGSVGGADGDELMTVHMVTSETGCANSGRSFHRRCTFDHLRTTRGGTGGRRGCRGGGGS